MFTDRYSSFDMKDEDAEDLTPHISAHYKRTRTRGTLCYHATLAVFFSLLGFAISTILQKPPSPQAEMLSPVPLNIREVKIEKYWMPNDTFNPPGGRTPESDRAWDTRHKKFVMIYEPEQFDLHSSGDAPPDIAKGAQMYAVSSFHQFHCLRIIRYSWYEALEKGAKVLEDTSGIPNSPPGKFLGAHVDHCLDLLRQALECHADPALEPFVASDGITPLPHGSSGWGVKHFCRDFDALERWANERNIPAVEGDFHDHVDK